MKYDFDREETWTEIGHAGGMMPELASDVVGGEALSGSAGIIILPLAQGATIENAIYTDVRGTGGSPRSIRLSKRFTAAEIR